MAKLLRASCIIGLSGQQLRTVVVEQMKWQKEFLKSQRLRRHDVLLAFEDIIALSSSNSDNFSSYANKRMGEVFNKFVSDGVKWQGRGLSNNLDGCVNAIAYQCIHTMMLTRIMMDDNVLLPENTTIPLRLLLKDICEDVGALAKEKFGVAPSVNIVGDLTIVKSIPSLYEYVVVEFLKNAIKSVIDKHGALHAEDVDDVLLIELVDSDVNTIGNKSKSLTITDKGVGMTPLVLSRFCFYILSFHFYCWLRVVCVRCLDAFYTTSLVNDNPNYYYSRDFGVPFNGAGFGMTKSKVTLCVQ